MEKTPIAGAYLRKDGSNVKRGMYKLTALVLCLALLLPLAGCGADPQTAQTVGALTEAMRTVERFCFTLSAEGEGELAGERIRLTAAGDGDWQSAPFALHMDAAFGVGDFLELKTPVVLESRPDGLCAYMGARVGDEPLWTALPLKGVSAPALSDYTGLLALLTGGGRLVTLDPALSDDEALCLCVTVPGVLLSGAQEDLELRLWLDRESSLPLRLETDLAALAQAALSGSENSLLQGLTVSRLPVTLTLTGVRRSEESAQTAQAIEAFQPDGPLWAA